MQVFAKNNWGINWNKTKIAKTKICFMGLEVSLDGKCIGIGRIKSIKNSLDHFPRTKKEIKSILGKFGFVRNFMANYAESSMLLENSCRNENNALFQRIIADWINQIKPGFSTRKI